MYAMSSDISLRFIETCCLHRRGRSDDGGSVVTETPWHVYQTTRHHSPEHCGCLTVNAA